MARRAIRLARALARGVSRDGLCARRRLGLGGPHVCAARRPPDQPIRVRALASDRERRAHSRPGHVRARLPHGLRRQRQGLRRYVHAQHRLGGFGSALRGRAQGLAAPAARTAGVRRGARHRRGRGARHDGLRHAGAGARRAAAPFCLAAAGHRRRHPMARSRSNPAVDGRAVEVAAGGRVLCVWLSHRLQDRDQAARGRVRREVHEQRPFGVARGRRAGEALPLSDTLLLAGADVERLLTAQTCIAAVEDAFRQHALGKLPASGILGMHAERGGFHLKAGFLDSYFAAKINANFPENADLPTIQGAVLMFDATNGRPLAVMDSIAITALRTAAATAVAAKYLAREDADTALICGCGAQAGPQLQALLHVRRPRRLLAYDCDRSRAAAFAARFNGTAVEDVAEAARSIDIVVTCTPARRYFIARGMIRPGTFIAAVGADNESKQEIEPALLAQAKVVTDLTEQAARIGDLHHAIEARVMSVSGVHAELGEVVAGRKPGRERPDEIFVFDSTGTGLQDVAAAVAVYQSALAERLSMKRTLLTFAFASATAVSARAETEGFDTATRGSLPSGWECGVTGKGTPRWSVEPDPTAPSAPQVLQQSGSGTFLWCVRKDASLADGHVEVKFKPLHGREDQAGGVIWRWKDGNNYYVARANALENNVSLYYTENGRRNTLKYVDAPVPLNVWHSLRVEFSGKRIRVILDGKTYIELDDGHIAGAGAVGVWTKADSVTLFDDFSYGGK